MGGVFVRQKSRAVRAIRLKHRVIGKRGGEGLTAWRRGTRSRDRWQVGGKTFTEYTSSVSIRTLDYGQSPIQGQEGGREKSV